MEEEEEENVNRVVMDYDTNYYKLSSDIAKETWVVGGIQDSLFRSRSWNK
ncbi:BnaA09g30770D [Brassica napus]|uniref:BnaA09g30770D protein n=2 Tax=Brassica napus TaxID=3708 RepID=A0A078G4G0_BRANA|nr:BnaA09g30770D [Brassica napus]